MKTQATLLLTFISLTAYANNSENRCIDLSVVTEDSCQLVKGGTARRAIRGAATGLEINGRFWSDVLPGTYSNENEEGQATEACRKLGLRLPNNEDFRALTCSFGCEEWYRDVKFTEYGLAEFHQVMSQAKDGTFWSSSTEYNPFVYHGNFGGVSAEPRYSGCPPHHSCAPMPNRERVLCVE